MKTAEVAKALRVTVATVNKWARDGVIECITLPSAPGSKAQRRFRREDVMRLLSPSDVEAQAVGE